MDIRKIFFIISILIISAILPNISLSAYDTPIYLGVTELKTETTPNIGYAIGNLNSNQEIGNATKIWNIVKYTQENSNDPTEADFYCVKAGVGFSDIHRTASYDKKFDLKTEQPKIKEQNVILSQLVNSEYYNHLLALIDMIYIPDESNQEEKYKLLENAKINKEDWDFELTNDDIEAVQQAAIWYFTNYGEEDGKYDKYSDLGWLNYTTNGNTYTSLSSYNVDIAPNENGNKNSGEQRQQQAEMLYKYLIDTAKTNSVSYKDKISLDEPITINTTILNSQTTEECYIVGPINITQNNGLPYNINLNIRNQEDIDLNDKIVLLDKNKKETNKTLKELVGTDFYIQLPRAETTTVNLTINATYKITNATLYASSTNNQEQPVILIEKENKPINVQLKVTPEQNTFDLALRQYITKVNGIELSDTRVPNINTDILKLETTSSYKHRKDPVVIESGDIVTYKLTIYNEGQKSGRATKVINQLPEGLQFNKIVSGDFEKLNYDEISNRLELTRKEDNKKNLDGYNVNNQKLSSETIEIECKVITKADEEDEKILTNVAWISELFDAEDNITISNNSNQDRDSEPSTMPDVKKDNMSNYKGYENKADLTDSEYYYKGQQDDDDFEKLILIPKRFDLKLIKRIVEVNGESIEERIKKVDISKLNTINSEGKVITTGNYIVNKEPVSVKKGDIVKYTFRIYNEGNSDGYASELKESIPEGLEFIYSADVTNDTSLSDAEKKAIEFNNSMLWEISNTDTNMKITEVSSKYLSKESEIENNGNLIKAFGTNDGTKKENDISYKEMSIMLKVISDDVTGTLIRNEACISKCSDKDGQDIKDRDSTPEQWIKYEDDEDYDSIKLQSFDLALRKFIIAVSKDEKIHESDYLKNANGSYIRAPQVDTSKLNTEDENKNTITTAIYNHLKTPVSVMRGDIVVYMLRIYNEGEIDGYANEIADYLPEYLQFVDGEFNKQYGWKVSEDGRTIKTNYLADSKISKATKNEQGTIVLNYKEIPIMCKISQNAKTNEVITNIAEITDYKDENKKYINDRDSQKANIKLPSEDKLPEYKSNENNTYISGQQDDDDFEKVVIKKFDLSLRNFITQVNDNDITTRTPKVKYDKENNHITYEHIKEPVEVVANDMITYTIRIYNEGEVNGYASKIANDIPQGLEFLPDNDINKTYRWKMIDSEGKETTDTTKAVTITTDYLSKEQGEIRAKKGNVLKENESIIKYFNTNKELSEQNPSYADIKITFRVIESDTLDKTIINSAQISETEDERGNKVDDEDSRTEIWNDGADNQDKEYIKLTHFDLALRKCVTQAIIIENGKEIVTNTGHIPNDEVEEVVKVELNRKKLENVIVKFKYSIRVINEGDIAGYAKEITDYIPEGLKFVEEDNIGWTNKDNNIITTTILEDKLLQPGEYEDIEVLLTWINGKDNIGVKTNIAEISEYENNKNIKDIDSISGNKIAEEDDIDEAQVILSISTGQIRIYFILGFTILITIAIGIILIKNYVL